jgi:hypothetical protein
LNLSLYWVVGTNQLMNYKMEDDTQQKIIALQEEMIQLLTNGIQARDKFIEFLEKQLERAENFIITQNEQQQK